MQETTDDSVFPQDELRRAVQRLVRLGGFLEPGSEAGVQLSLSEVMALGELADVDGLSQGELARRLGLEKSTASRLAAGLTERGWLVRERDPANRRYYRLRLTDAGRATAHHLGQDFRAQHAELFHALTPEELTGLITGLNGLVRVLAGREHHRGHPWSGSTSPG